MVYYFLALFFVFQNCILADYNQQKIKTVFEIINSSYVKKVDNEKLTEAALNAMVNALDNHSGYLTKEEYQELQDYTKGQYVGIGAELSIENGKLKIICPIEGSPAERSGIMAGDRILKVNGEKINENNVKDLILKIRGQANTSVNLEISRPSSSKTIKTTIIRRKIILQPVKYGLLSKDIAYIRISNFVENNTEKKIKNALAEMKKWAHIKAMILDLRNNPGGQLEQAIAVSSIFLDDKIVTQTKGRGESDITYYKTTKNTQKILDLPMIVLINKGSASASEIVASALQDHKRAIIIGENSYGKGSVQSIIPLKDGDAIGLTTAYYYTPHGHIIDGIGVKPDIKIIKNNQHDKLSLAMIVNNENINIENYKNDPQLIKAVALIKDKELYKHIMTKEKNEK